MPRKILLTIAVILVLGAAFYYGATRPNSDIATCGHFPKQACLDGLAQDPNSPSPDYLACPNSPLDHGYERVVIKPASCPEGP
jgi:hypothetical protein